MHAYASDDPVFRAMNARGQRETGGDLGTFCVQVPRARWRCARASHERRPQPRRAAAGACSGVTCYFCHAAESVEGTHNNPLRAGRRTTACFGPFGDPAPGTPHAALYSRLLDGATLESASTLWQLPRHPEPAGRARRAHVRGVAGHAVRVAARRPVLRPVPHADQRANAARLDDARRPSGRCTVTPCPAVDLAAHARSPTTRERPAARAGAGVPDDSTLQSDAVLESAVESPRADDRQRRRRARLPQRRDARPPGLRSR